MKKVIVAIVCVAAFVGIALPLSSVGALENTVTDTISVTIENNCALSYDSTAHTDGDGAWGSGLTANTLSATRNNGSVTTGLGSTAFSVTCNDGEGSQVALTATSLTSEYSDTIPFSGNEPSSTTSSWGVSNGTSWLSSGNNIWYSENSVSGSTFSATYGVGIDSTQSAGTYTGTATYTLTHPYVPESDYYLLTFEPYDTTTAQKATISTSSYQLDKSGSTTITINGKELLLGSQVIATVTSLDESYDNFGWFIDGTPYKSGSYTVTKDTTIYYVVSIGCVAKGSLISMADGTTKNVEDIEVGDEVLGYNYYDGNISATKVYSLMSDTSEAKVFTVTLEDGKSLQIVDNEYLFDVDAKEFILIDIHTYQESVGKNVMINDDGKVSSSKIASITYETKEIEHYTMITENIINYIANNMIVNTPVNFVNDIYTVGDDFKIDMAQYTADVKKYGVYTYEEFEDVCTRETFDKLGIKNYKIVVGKGLISFEDFKQGVKEQQREIDYYATILK